MKRFIVHLQDALNLGAHGRELPVEGQLFVVNIVGSCVLQSIFFIFECELLAAQLKEFVARVALSLVGHNFAGKLGNDQACAPAKSALGPEHVCVDVVANIKQAVA